MHFDLNMGFTVKIYMHRARTTHKHLIVSFSYMFSFFETGSHVASNFLRSGGLPRIYASPTSTDEENQRIICAYYQAKSVLGNHNKEWRIQNESPAAPLLRPASVPCSKGPGHHPSAPPSFGSLISPNTPPLEN